LIWIILQLIIFGLIFFRSNYKKQIIALPIISLLFITLFANWTFDLKDIDNYRKFDREMWMNGNPFFRINYVEDIVKNNLLENKCYPEIIEMLGRPNIENQNTLEYELGFGELIIQLNDKCYENVEIKCK